MSKLFATTSAARMAIAVAAIFTSALAVAEPLKVCSDPDNLPFSKSEGASRGLYIELAELVGKQLGVPVEYNWYLTYNQRRAIRNSMDACDAYFALPASPDYKANGMDRTKPFLDVRYAVVSKPGFRMAQMNDLKGRTVGVTFSSPPQIYFSTAEGYSVKAYRNSEQVIAAIQSGEVDVGVLWGPHIGYLNQTEYNNYWQLTPISGTGLGGQVAVAVPKGKDALKLKIEDALSKLRPEIEQLEKKYGFPTGVPVALDDHGSWNMISSHVAGGKSVAKATYAARPQVQAVKAQAFASDAADFRAYLRKVNDGGDIDEFRKVFNSRCSHCHSQNGASPQPERDLRRLSSRYGEKWREVAVTTITNGRPEFGMPNWGASLSKQEIDNMVTYLETIQKKPQ